MLQAPERVAMLTAMNCAKLLALDKPRDARLHIAASLAQGGILQLMHSEALRLLHMAESAGELAWFCRTAVSVQQFSLWEKLLFPRTSSFWEALPPERLP